MPIRDLLLALCVPLIWGLGFTFAKAGLGEIPPLLLMGLRFSIAALVLVWFVKPPTGHYLEIFWIALVSATIQYGLTFSGLAMMDASLAVIVVQLEIPFGVLLGVILLRERPGLQRIIGLVIAFAGIVLIAGQPSLKEQLFPMLLTASGAFMWAVGQIMVKRLDGAVDGFALIAWVGVFAGPQMIASSFLIEDGQLAALANATWVGWSTVLYLGLVMTALGYGIWYHVLSRNPVSQVMPVLLLLPLFSIAGSMLFLGERPGAIVFAGGAVVLTGVALITVVRRERVAATAG